MPDDLDSHPFFTDPPDNDNDNDDDRDAERTISRWAWAGAVITLTALIAAACVLLMLAAPGAHADTPDCAHRHTLWSWWVLATIVAAVGLGVVAAFAVIAGTATRRMEDHDQ